MAAEVEQYVRYLERVDLEFFASGWAEGKEKCMNYIKIWLNAKYAENMNKYWIMQEIDLACTISTFYVQTSIM